MKLYNIESDSALARRLGLSRQAIGHHMKGRVFLGQETALQVAELLDRAPDYVIACAEAERAQSDRTRAHWRNAAERAAGIAASIFIVVFAFGLDYSVANLSFAFMALAVPDAQPVYYVKLILAVIFGFVLPYLLLRFNPKK